jgi:transcriptional regulator with XRE-family HTH domain
MPAVPWQVSVMDKSIYTREYTILRELLRQTRRRAKLTQTEVAARIGQTQSFVTKCERGERRLDVIQLRTICLALGTTLTAFTRKLERRLAEDRH